MALPPHRPSATGKTQQWASVYRASASSTPPTFTIHRLLAATPNALHFPWDLARDPSSLSATLPQDVLVQPAISTTTDGRSHPVPRIVLVFPGLPHLQLSVEPEHRDRVAGARSYVTVDAFISRLYQFLHSPLREVLAQLSADVRGIADQEYRMRLSTSRNRVREIDARVRVVDCLGRMRMFRGLELPYLHEVPGTERIRDVFVVVTGEIPAYRRM